MSFNKVMLLGNVSKDVDLRYTGKGDPFTRFSIAVDRFKKGEVDFFWEDSEGNSRSKIEVIANGVTLLSSKGSAGASKG